MKKRKALIIILFIIILSTVVTVLWVKNNNTIEITKNDVEEYLKSKYKGYTFSNISFNEKDKYIINKRFAMGTSTRPKKNGTYTRYKVHSNKDNIDFNVQYLSSAKRMEDDLSITKDKRDIQVKLSEIYHKYFPNSSDPYYASGTGGERGVLETAIPYLNVDIDKPLNSFYEKDFTSKIKMLRDEINLYFQNNKQYKDSLKFDEFTMDLNSDNCSLLYKVKYGLNNDNCSTEIIYFITDIKNNPNISFKEIKEQILKNYSENEKVSVLELYY